MPEAWASRWAQLPPLSRQRKLLRRPRLLNLLRRHIDSRLQLVCTAAGAGKTSLLLDFAIDAPAPVCWYTAEPSDHDPALLLRHLGACVAQKSPEHREWWESADRALSRGGHAALESVVTSVAPASSGAKDPSIVLVLDAFHQVSEDPGVLSLVSGLLEHSPKDIHYIFAGRSLPKLPCLATLGVQAQVQYWHTQDLAFTPQEVRSLLHKTFGIRVSREEAAHLADRWGGWATGIILHAQTVGTGPVMPLLDSARVNALLFQYLSMEVVAPQPSHVHDTLLKSSVLRYMTLAACEDVLGLRHPAGFLHEVDQRNLFLTKAPGEEERYRFHEFFRMFLLAQLWKQDPATLTELYHRAAQHFEMRGNLLEAVSYLTDIGDEEQIAQVAAQLVPSLFKDGEWRTLADLVSKLPPAVVRESALLLSYQAMAAVRLGQTEASLQLFDRAMALVEDSSDVELVAQCLLGRAAAFRVTGNYDDAVEDCQRALALLFESLPSSRQLGLAREQLAAAYGQKGDFQRGKRELDKALKELQEGTALYESARLHTTLGALDAELGDLDSALAHDRKAQTAWQQLGNTPQLANALNNMGVVYYNRGLLDDAHDLLKQAMSLARECGYLRIESYACVGLGDVERERGAYEQALELYREGEKLAYHSMEAQPLSRAFCGIGETFRLQGELERAKVIVGQGLAQAKFDKHSLEIGLLSCTLGTIHLQESSWEQAEALLAQASQVLNAAGARQACAVARFRQARLAFARRRFTEALGHLSVVSRLCKTLGYDGFLLAEAKEAPSLVWFEESRKVGDGQFSRIATGLEGAEPDGAGPGAALAGSPSTRIQPPGVEAHALGSTSVVLNGQEVSRGNWRSEKAKELFFLLLYNPEGLRKEQIVYALWPDISIVSTNASFHTTVYRLRHALAPDVLVRRQGSYQLNAHWAFRFDVSEFQTLLATADKEPSESQKRFQALERAADLYNGPFLQDYYSDWCETARRDLETQFMRLVYELTAWYLGVAKAPQAILLLDRTLQMNPLDENSYRYLMRAYLAAGNPLMAVHTYHRCREVVANDLGVEPSKLTQQLLQEAQKELTPR